MTIKRAKHICGFWAGWGVSLLLVLCGETGCATRPMGMPVFARDVQSPDPSVRVKAVIYAGNSGDKRVIPALVDRLEDNDEVVRMAAIESLKQLTGYDFGYRSSDPPYKRLVAVEQWRKWLKEGQPKLAKPQPSRSECDKKT